MRLWRSYQLSVVGYQSSVIEEIRLVENRNTMLLITHNSLLASHPRHLLLVSLKGFEEGGALGFVYKGFCHLDHFPHVGDIDHWT